MEKYKLLIKKEKEKKGMNEWIAAQWFFWFFFSIFKLRINLNYVKISFKL